MKQLSFGSFISLLGSSIGFVVTVIVFAFLNFQTKSEASEVNKNIESSLKEIRQDIRELRRDLIDRLNKIR